jgi:hypothetical protein
MKEMGYNDKEKCLAMLAAANGNIADAVEFMGQ